MLPSELSADRFSGYPPRAHRVALGNLALLRKLPLGFLPLLLRELIALDWGFPAEQREIERAGRVSQRPLGRRTRHSDGAFGGLRLAPELEGVDWAGSPARFSELLTAHLWATGQIDGFRAAAMDYIAKMRAAAAPDVPAIPRLGIVVIGRGVKENRYALFRYLRPHGVWFRHANPADGWQILREAVAERAAAHPVPYGHWQIDEARRRRPPASRVSPGERWRPSVRRCSSASAKPSCPAPARRRCGPCWRKWPRAISAARNPRTPHWPASRPPC